jgi:hypothetical protein
LRRMKGNRKRRNSRELRVFAGRLLAVPADRLAALA